MIFATILSICTTLTAPCNEYIIDTATNSQDGVQNKVIQTSAMRRVWKDDRLLQAHLAKFKIVEPIGDVQSYEVRNEIVQDEMFP